MEPAFIAKTSAPDVLELEDELLELELDELELDELELELDELELEFEPELDGFCCPPQEASANIRNKANKF